MAYVAVSGGREAIEESIRLLDFFREGTEEELKLQAIEEKMGLLVDRVMSEAGFYNCHYAAIALKQSEGCVEEAVFLLRAFRSTLTRNYYTKPADLSHARLIRRISAAFKDIEGGQMLGATYDYTHRLLNFDLEEETAGDLTKRVRELLKNAGREPVEHPNRVSDTLKAEGLIEAFPEDDTEPFDVTSHMLEFPAPRSARLQTLTRADTGYISGLAYSCLRGFGQVHPTVGELRSGYLELEVPYLFGEDQSMVIGEILVTEVESFAESDDGDKLKLSVGYGAVFGRNENKAIAMSILDRELDEGGTAPTNDEEFVLMHGDSLEMNGFISHLKLPHYVTFQSKLDAVRKTREEKSHE